MIKQNLFINLIGFKLKNEKVPISFFDQEKPGFSRLGLKQLPIELPGLKEFMAEKPDKVLYCDFSSCADADYQCDVDLKKNKNFSIKYYRFHWRRILEGRGYVLMNNMVKDLELWKRTPHNDDNLSSFYQAFSIRLQLGRVSHEPEMAIMDQGLKRISKLSMAEIEDYQPSDFRKLFYRDILYGSFDDLPEEARLNLNEVYPKINQNMEKKFGKLVYGRNDNKYLTIGKNLKEFKNELLGLEEIKTFFQITNDGWLKVPDSKVFFVNDASKNILLGANRDHTALSPKTALLKHGPVKSPPKPVIIFHIFFENDKEYAMRVFKEFKGFKDNLPNMEPRFIKDDTKKSLYDFVRMKYESDKRLAIILTPENPLEQVKSRLDEMMLDHEKSQYMAIYVSPVNKDDRDSGLYSFYYKLKEILLKYHIQSQVIYKEKLLHKDFDKYYKINIATAILAKAGGIPWDISHQTTDELIVGVGAFKSVELDTQYLGSAMSYKPNVGFQHFNCVSRNETAALSIQIKLMIQEFIKENKDIKSLTIHFYKTMSQQELKPIQSILYNLGYPDLPVYIVSINKTLDNDYIVFNRDSAELMPYSGTIVQIGHLQYLLFNNTNYANARYTSIESYNLPVKMSISSTHPENLENKELVKHLIDQIYQFSRLYYKSVKQQNLPVTITYPEMLAMIFPHFKSRDLPDFAKSSAWFL